jgi:predicted metal-dependent phosphotriesterase family hydrolase
VTGRVRTVLGDVDPGGLGITYGHEHLILDSPVVAERFPHIHLPSVDEAVVEVMTCREVGVRTMVDAMPEGGRDLEKLREVSLATGIGIVAATGLHTDRYYPHLDWTRSEPADRLARRFIADVRNGCGVIKAATDERGIDARAHRVFEAVAVAHAETGAPIITHCENGLGGPEQVELLVSLGVSPRRVALSHTDKVADRGYHRSLLETGVYLEYDQALREAEPTAGLVAAMIGAGFRDQLLLGTDGARRSLWATLGGSPGLAYLATGFTEVLDRHGVGPDDRHALFVDNPARWLTFSP